MRQCVCYRTGKYQTSRWQKVTLVTVYHSNMNCLPHAVTYSYVQHLFTLHGQIFKF